MQIRNATLADLPELLRIFAAARAFQCLTGNPTQWAGGYPDPGLIREDIARGVCYVCEQDGHPVGTFAMIPGEDPTYGYIKGNWGDTSPYVTLHRVASDGTCHGLAALWFDYALAQCGHVRIDTHEDNAVMRHLLDKHGFSYRGIIYLENGDPRLAYEKSRT